MRSFNALELMLMVFIALGTAQCGDNVGEKKSEAQKNEQEGNPATLEDKSSQQIPQAPFHWQKPLYGPSGGPSVGTELPPNPEDFTIEVATPSAEAPSCGTIKPHDSCETKGQKCTLAGSKIYKDKSTGKVAFNSAILTCDADPLAPALMGDVWKSGNELSRSEK